MPLSKSQKIGIGVGLAVLAAAIAALVWWLLRRKSDDDAGRTDPIPSPTPDPVPDPPILVDLPDPMAPTLAPVKGKYYIVKSGDSDAKIVQLAGFEPGRVYAARKKMRDHERNAWIPKKADDPETSYDERALNLFAGWAPMVGKESLTWAWQTAQITYGNKKWPIVYVPSDSEVSA